MAGTVGTRQRRPGALEKTTGRDRDGWFAVLDGWGAKGRAYREIFDWLVGEHRLSDWWAQKLIVEYEQARGVRPAGVRRDGTFEVGASRTVAAPAGHLLSAFMDRHLREGWLPGVTVDAQASRPEGTLRFDWEGGPSRVVVTFTASGATKTLVALQHQRLPDAATAARMKTYWRDRLTALKATVEA
jgi:uncharacterized protein YndB with AHSA1/START domain